MSFFFSPGLFKHSRDSSQAISTKLSFEDIGTTYVKQGFISSQNYNTSQLDRVWLLMVAGESAVKPTTCINK